MDSSITEAAAVLLTLCVMGAYYAGIPRFTSRADGLVLSILVPSLVILVIAALLPAGHLPSDRLERARAELALGLPEGATTELRTWLEVHPDDLEAHRLYVQAHFQQPLSRGRGRHRDDTELLAYYEDGAAHGLTRAISSHGLSLYWSSQHDYVRALAELDEIPAPSPLALLDRGRVLLGLGRPSDAYDSLARAAAEPSVRARAVWDMSDALERDGRWDDLARLVKDPADGPATAPRSRRAVFLHLHEWLAYGGEFLRAFYMNASLGA